LRKWKDLCDLKNMNEWAINEGLNKEDTIFLTLDEAKQLNIIK
jgi:hypothetical protein